MTFEEIVELISSEFGEEVILEKDLTSSPESLFVPVDQVAKICRFLYEHEATYFDFLSCLTAIDNGPQINTMEVVYNLYSIPFDHHLMLKVVVPRNEEGKALPEVPSVSHIWRTADWHEREAFDLVGIAFKNHPDLRRILLPADWKGNPLRKDYQDLETYHGIKVEY
ncbi:NADH-quinone oxidoreductase subunit C [Xanthovirga aplysinae]|uniref:NADH-quinone oxidoreductase subunit C n=1 Tax=Xanthovirga aplysinae TaxID=2529853 RepID=UPI0012BC75F1|nr:NADH-quinone oxidoreductase subunit C [Xanthovirga aplysinae]MTI32896.1 NADH-quinone oxidoreductase subunit C [Xanthovirga aplysinae]